MDIVCGICLFNHYIINGSLLGSVDPSILKTAPTLHELEYLARAPRAIADVAAMLISRTRERDRCSATKITVGLDIPSFQSHHSVVEVFDRGSCTSKTALAWIDAVDLRHNQLEEVFTSAIQYELQQRGTASTDYEIHISPKSSLVASSVREALQRGDSPCLEYVLRRLDSDLLWHDFYRYIPVRDKPRDWKDLA